MFISCAASAANGFNKWSAANPAVKYTSVPDEAAPVAATVPDACSPHAERVESFRPVTDFRHSAIHIRRAARLRKTAEAAPVGGPLRARLLDLALQYDRMAARARRVSAEARQMEDV